MIKRIQFAAKRERISAGDLVAAWHEALAEAMVSASEGASPLRTTVCATLADVEGCDARHDAIAFQWFDDAAHLARFDAWLATDAGVAHQKRIDEVVAPGSLALVVAEEHVMRGEGWLEQHWRDGGDTFKHMAVAMRAAGLTQAQFSELWATRAGQVRTSDAAAATVIPDEARGLAYVQNHPAPRADADWDCDAVNEVYFDDLDALRVRVDFFAQTLGDQPEDDLVSDNWFVIAREAFVAP